MSTVVISEKVEKFLASLGRPEGIQSESYERLLELDFPTTKDEYWKYTRLGKIANSSFTISEGSSLTSTDSFKSEIISENYLVIENGIPREDLSSVGNASLRLIEAAEVVDFSNDIRPNQLDIFNVLNMTYLSKGILIGGSGELQLVFVETGEGNIINNRIQVRLEKSSELNIIQSFISLGKENFVNTVAQYYVEENANLNIDILQHYDGSTSAVTTTEVYQEQNSNFKVNTATVAGQLIRNNINIAVAGQNCNTFMNGAVITKDKMHVDNHTFVDHKVPHCESNENYKYVLNGQSTGVFNGKVIVRPDAQIINAYQNNGNILLSDQASINSKPELEIYADDVKCSHGSTTGQLDEDALFYLQSRGISKEAGRQMLVSAFIKEIIEEFQNEKVVAQIEAAVQAEHGWNF